MTPELLLSLQLGDSAYPSGAFAFSWGLEGAAADGQVDRASFGAWAAGELLQRWARFDRPVLAAAWARRGDDLLAYDLEVDRLFWAEPVRRRSAEAGAVFLAAAARLGSETAARLSDAAHVGRAAGHPPVAQGAVYAEVGLPLDHALAVSAHMAAQGLASAGVRLGLISAFDGQRVLGDLRPDIAAAIAGTDGADEEPAPFAPISEISMFRPADGRLFVN
ncbi:MAG: urease accessory UreF family protein [Pseudomonadota bacterium]